MATYPIYPATTFTQAVELTIFSSNQLHDVINGDALTTVETENGDVPTLRKALVDNFYFKTPIEWVAGESSTIFNQLYYYNGTLSASGWYYAPQATADNPVAMGGTPVDDDNWRLYQPATQSIPAQVYPWYTEITSTTTSVSPPYEFDTAIVTLNGVVLTPTKDYTIANNIITFTSSLVPEPDAEYADILFCYIGKIEEGNASTNYVTYNALATSTAAALIGTASGENLQEVLNKGASGIALTQGGTVQDGLGCVYASTFGVYMQPTSVISSGTPVDMTDRLQNAINKAKELNVPLVLDFAFEVGSSTPQFIYVTKTIDIGGLREIRGSLLIAVLPETFTPTYKTPDTPPRGVVLKNLNGQYDASGKQYFSTTRGGQTFDTISVASLRDYTDETLIGQLHTTCYSHFKGQLWGRRFGTCIRFANTYDCSFAGQVACVNGGSLNYYPLEVGSFPAADRADESNSLTFPRLLLHTNKYRDASVVGSKINVTAVHAEDCDIGSLAGLVPKYYDSFCPNGIASLSFGLTGGSIGNINYNVRSTSVSKAGLMINTMGTHVAQIYCDRAQIDTILSDVYFLGRGGSFGSIYTEGDVYTDGGSPLSIENLNTSANLKNAGVRSQIGYAKVGGDVTLNAGIIEYLTCSGSVTQNQYGYIKNGMCSGDFIMSASGKLDNFTISGAFNSAAAGPVLNGVVFNGAFNNTGGGTFNRCTIPAFAISTTSSATIYNTCNISGTVTIGVSNARANFNDCSVSAYNFDNSVTPTIRINRGSSGGISISGTTGTILIDYGHVCTSGVSIPGWVIPTATNVGYGAKTVNPYTGKGWILLWNGTAAQWFPLQVQQ
jgi:hypothetical protein|nr:MAG TPA: hypothetical protein [Caudoviricetes sp.]